MPGNSIHTVASTELLPEAGIVCLKKCEPGILNRFFEGFLSCKNHGSVLQNNLSTENNDYKVIKIWIFSPNSMTSSLCRYTYS